MTKLATIRRRLKASEEGYVILIAIFLMALLVISLGIAAPQVAKSIQRDKDLETYRRGLQYRRAIQLYYRKFHSYPPNVDALVETNNIRFLRKKYVDPITNKVDWKPVLFGQNKTPTAMGFFGQPLAGGNTTIAGIGPGGGNGGGGNGAGGSGGGTVMPGGMGFLGIGSTSSSGAGSTGSGSPTGNSGGAGSASSTTNSTTSPGTNSSGGPGSSNGSDQSGQSGGQTFGGGGIIGFSPASPRKSILIYKKKEHYNEWEFTYDPISDMQTVSGGNAGGSGLPGNNGQPGGNGTNTPASSSPFGGANSGPPNTPSPSPNTPQQ